MLNKKQLEKIENRIKEIDQFLNDNRDYSKFDSNALFNERAELKFKRNKDNINIRLSCNNKYYYAAQCNLFTKNVLKNGYPYIDKKTIKEKGISFNKYSINVGYNQYCQDLKSFNSKEEMLGFVIGYNAAVNK
mgnify:CR=1 FL=1